MTTMNYKLFEKLSNDLDLIQNNYDNKTDEMLYARDNNYCENIKTCLYSLIDLIEAFNHDDYEIVKRVDDFAKVFPLYKKFNERMKSILKNKNVFLSMTDGDKVICDYLDLCVNINWIKFMKIYTDSAMASDIKTETYYADIDTYRDPFMENIFNWFDFTKNVKDFNSRVDENDFETLAEYVLMFVEILNNLFRYSINACYWGIKSYDYYTHSYQTILHFADNCELYTDFYYRALDTFNEYRSRILNINGLINSHYDILMKINDLVKNIEKEFMEELEAHMSECIITARQIFKMMDELFWRDANIARLDRENAELDKEIMRLKKSITKLDISNKKRLLEIAEKLETDLMLAENGALIFQNLKSYNYGNEEVVKLCDNVIDSYNSYLKSDKFKQLLEWFKMYDIEFKY